VAVEQVNVESQVVVDEQVDEQVVGQVEEEVLQVEEELEHPLVGEQVDSVGVHVENVQEVFELGVEILLLVDDLQCFLLHDIFSIIK
jgi:hypothetical protein